ncbi:anti-sigma factor antagonist [Nocardia thraciensis]
MSGPAAISSRLTGDIEFRGPALLLRAQGEVDACTLPTWKHLLDAAAAAVTAPGPLVVDLEQLDFIGCRAFAALADEAARCRRRGIDLHLVSTASIVPRIIGAADLSALLPVYRSADTAASAG